MLGSTCFPCCDQGVCKPKIYAWGAVSGTRGALTELANCTVFGRSTVPTPGNPTSPGNVVTNERRMVRFGCSVGANAFFGIDTSGKLWAWGYASAEFGLSTLVRLDEEQQIFPDDTWSDICQATSSSGATVWGLKTNGTLWEWGGSISTPQQVTLTVYDEINAATGLPINRTISTFDAITQGGFISGGQAWVRTRNFPFNPGRWARILAVAMRYKITYTPTFSQTIEKDAIGNVSFLFRKDESIVAISGGKAYLGSVCDGRYSDYFKDPPGIYSGTQAVGVDVVGNDPGGGNNTFYAADVQFPGSSYVAGVAGAYGYNAWTSSGTLHSGTYYSFTQINGSYKSVTPNVGWQCAVTSSGGLVAWGSNQYGTTAQGTTTGSLSSPTAITTNDADGNPISWSFVQAPSQFNNVCFGAT